MLWEPECVKPCVVVGSEVLTAVVMKVNIFWDIEPCNSYIDKVSEERINSIFRAKLAKKEVQL
jgi:hypothetical protein